MTLTSTSILLSLANINPSIYIIISHSIVIIVIIYFIVIVLLYDFNLCYY